MQDNQTFLNYIDSEINTLQNKIHQPGWTKWAIMGSMFLNEFHALIRAFFVFCLFFTSDIIKNIAAIAYMASLKI